MFTLVWIIFLGLFPHSLVTYNLQLNMLPLNNALSANLLRTVSWFKIFQNDQQRGPTINSQDSFQRHFQHFTKFVYRNTSNVSQLYARNIVNALCEEKNYLEKIKRAAVKFEAYHKYNWYIEEFEYNKRKLYNINKIHQRIPHGLKIRDFNQSDIEIPLSLYEYDTKLLNQIRWSDNLDDVFKENYRKRPHLVWQYIGFTTGASRMYPSSIKM